MNIRMRWLMLLGLAAALALTASPPARAQSRDVPPAPIVPGTTEVVLPLDGSILAGFERVHVSGWVHVVTHVFPPSPAFPPSPIQPPQPIRIDVHANLFGASGVGLTTGLRYLVDGADFSSILFPPSPLLPVFRLSFRVGYPPSPIFPPAPIHSFELPVRIFTGLDAEGMLVGTGAVVLKD